MSKLSTRFNLKEMYAIKHSLQLNLKYKDLSLVGAAGSEKDLLEKDIIFEKKLLEKVSKEINDFKNKNKIS